MKKFNQLYETIRLIIRRKYMHLTAKQRKKTIDMDDFTIISNNCWGGFIYQSYGIKYNTPTIGCFFMAKDYIKFISNIKHYLKQSLKYIDSSSSKWYPLIKDKPDFNTYPIGKLDDIEIHFLHYSSFEEAFNKWENRLKRINYEKIIYKFSEMNDCDEADILSFQKLDIPNKICFISSKYKKLKNDFTIVLSQKEVTASHEPFGNSRLININHFLNEINKKGEQK
ncbi:MAG: DUF1919 domain-containing protein [Erysipelotrichales bacterium]|nr:DUF1919 domain-containing protein [Erysipelotrichales bacterium]